MQVHLRCYHSWCVPFYSSDIQDLFECIIQEPHNISSIELHYLTTIIKESQTISQSQKLLYQLIVLTCIFLFWHPVYILHVTSTTHTTSVTWWGVIRWIVLHILFSVYPSLVITVVWIKILGSLFMIHRYVYI